MNFDKKVPVTINIKKMIIINECQGKDLKVMMRFKLTLARYSCNPGANIMALVIAPRSNMIEYITLVVTELLQFGQQLHKEQAALVQQHAS